MKELLSGTRLLTFTGPGGTGKTRLAIQTATGLLDEFADGCFFVPLSPISDPSLVLSSIPQVLGVQEAGDRPIGETLNEYLEPKELLLVLDNFEQIVEAGSSVWDLLTHSPGLKEYRRARMFARISRALSRPSRGERASASRSSKFWKAISNT